MERKCSPVSFQEAYSSSGTDLFFAEMLEEGVFVCLFVCFIGEKNYSKKDRAILYYFFFFFSPLQKKVVFWFFFKKVLTYLTSTVLCTVTFQAAADAMCPRTFVFLSEFLPPGKRATLFWLHLTTTQALISRCFALSKACILPANGCGLSSPERWIPLWKEMLA